MNIPYNFIYNIIRNDEISTLIDDIINRLDTDINDENFDDDLTQCINDSIIYYDDQWALLKWVYLTDIENANYYEALETIESYIRIIIKRYINR